MGVTDVTDAESINLMPEEREELENSINPRVGVTYRSQDFDVSGLVKRLERGDILIPRIGLSDPNLELNEFQRGFVWNSRQMDSFIESLLLEYPVPTLFLVQQQDRRLVVLDGQQRLETLRRFYSGTNGAKKYRLNLPGSQYSGKSYDELDERDRRVLDNTYITSTIILHPPSPAAMEAVYDVFARLNSGGTQLTAHEIRMALFNGKLMQCIDQKNNEPSWRHLYGTKQPSKRFRDHELILRILAFYLSAESYSKPLSGFLNDFSENYRDANDPAITKALELFSTAANNITESKISKPFSLEGKAQLNTARADAIMVSVMTSIAGGTTPTPTNIETMIDSLDKDEAFLGATTQSTSDEANVRERISLAKSALEKACNR